MRTYRELEEKFYADFVNGPTCQECGEPCEVVEIDDSFDYSGSHATHGRAGTHRVPTYLGSDCCEAEVE